MLTSEQIAEIKARVEAANPGPWRVEVHEPSLSRMVYSEDHTLDIDFGYVGNRTQEAAEFVAHARTDVPALLAEVERLQAKLDQPCGSCHPCSNYADQTWREAGRKPPHVYQWDELREDLAEIKRLAYVGGQDAETVRRMILGVFEKRSRS